VTHRSAAVVQHRRLQSQRNAPLDVLSTRHSARQSRAVERGRRGRTRATRTTSTSTLPTARATSVERTKGRDEALCTVVQQTNQPTNREFVGKVMYTVYTYAYQDKGWVVGPCGCVTRRAGARAREPSHRQQNETTRRAQRFENKRVRPVAPSRRFTREWRHDANVKGKSWN